MDFGNLFTRAWDTLWKNSFLILLGVLVVLGRGNSGSAGQSRYVFQAEDLPWGGNGAFDFGNGLLNGDFPNLAIGGALLMVLIALILFGLVFWALGLIARGGLISAVDDLESGKPTSFVTGFQAGWEKGWKLLGIGLVPAIPALILVVIIVSVLVFSGFRFDAGMDMGAYGMRTFYPILLFIICLFVPIMLIVSALQTFANRACMLEETGVIASYRRGLEVLGDNLGPAVILYLLQVVINIALGIIFLLPAIMAAICCLLWPLLILVQAAFVTFYSILWTLAWREWVGEPQVV